MEHKSEAVYNKWKSFIKGRFSAKEDNLLTWIIEYAENNKADILMDKIADLISSSTIGENNKIPEEIKTLSRYLGPISKFKEEFRSIIADANSLNVLKSINIDDYNSILGKWKRDHRRRKNLWKKLGIKIK